MLTQTAKQSLPVAALAVALLGTGCQSSVSIVDDIGERQAAIVNGAATTAYPAIGALVAGGGASACTATLIGRRTVLTAAHCVHQRWPVDFYIGDLNGTRYTAASVSVHPDYAGGNFNDLAVVRLSQPVVAVEPLRLAEQPPRAGEMVTLVGYGKTGEGEGDYGTKRVTSSRVSKVFDQLLTIAGGEGNVCDGDSGGPTLVARDGQEVVIGVHSTKGSVCGAAGNDMRVDVYLDWILHESERGQVDEQDQTPPTVEILSPASDARVGSSLLIAVAASDEGRVTKVVLKLDGQVAEVVKQAPYEFRLSKLSAGDHELEVMAFDTGNNSTSAHVTVRVVAEDIDRTFGETCRAANQCQSRICAASGAATASFCSRSCSIDAPCGGGFACVDGLCQLSPAMAKFGETCDASKGCGGGLCAKDDVTGQRFCTRTCAAGNLSGDTLSSGGLDASTCPSGSSCMLTGNAALSVCVPDTLAPEASPADLAQGCSLGDGDVTDAPLGLLLLGLLALLRRR